MRIVQVTRGFRIPVSNFYGPGRPSPQSPGRFLLFPQKASGCFGALYSKKVGHFLLRRRISSPRAGAPRLGLGFGCRLADLGVLLLQLVVHHHDVLRHCAQLQVQTSKVASQPSGRKYIQDSSFSREPPPRRTGPSGDTNLFLVVTLRALVVFLEPCDGAVDTLMLLGLRCLRVSQHLPVGLPVRKSKTPRAEGTGVNIRGCHRHPHPHLPEFLANHRVNYLILTAVGRCSCTRRSMQRPCCRRTAAVS